MKKFLFYASSLIALLAGIYFVPHKSVAPADDSVLPEKLQVTHVVTEGDDASLLDVVGLRREICGAVVFSLSPNTTEAVRREGLAFFADALQARGFPDQAYYRYGAWKETPAPRNWFGDGLIAGSLHCADLDRALWARIEEVSLRPGGFYSTKDEAQLIVLPGDGLVIFTYDG